MTTARSRMVQQPLPFMPVLSDALISPCGTYRYELHRSLDHQAVSDLYVQGTWTPRKRCLFVMLNPSTADGIVNDPTIEKCIKLARNWGNQVLDVGNLYAYRATDPKALRIAAAKDPLDLGMSIIGPENDLHLTKMAIEAETVVLAWGANSPLPERASEVIQWLKKAQERRVSYRKEEVKLYCLKQNKNGSPVHPLYQRDDSLLVPWEDRP